MNAYVKTSSECRIKSCEFTDVKHNNPHSYFRENMNSFEILPQNLIKYGPVRSRLKMQTHASKHSRERERNTLLFEFKVNGVVFFSYRRFQIIFSLCDVVLLFDALDDTCCALFSHSYFKCRCQSWLYSKPPQNCELCYFYRIYYITVQWHTPKRHNLFGSIFVGDDVYIYFLLLPSLVNIFEKL